VKINEVTREDRSYLYEGLTLVESKSVKLWETAGSKIVEAELTADQIQQLFQQVEKSATAAGGNRTALGQGKDVADAVNKAWTDLKTKVQNSGPVKNIDALYDQAAEKLKQATGGDAGVMQYVQKYRDFAKKHPIAQSLIYSALIAAAGISGAGVGGAAALGLLKMTDKLLQGEKFSSAAYSGAKTGAVAYGAGQIGKALQGTPGSVDNISWSKNGIPFSAQVDHGKVVGDIVMAGQTISPTDPNYASAAKAFLQAAGKEGMLGSVKNIGGAAGQDFSSFKESRYIDRKLTVYAWVLSESRGRPLGGVRLTNEGVMDAIKGVAGKAGQWAQTKGKNLTTRVTADKLQSAWKKAGSPTDSEDVAKVLKDAGVPEDTVKQVYTDMKVPLPGSPKDVSSVNTSTGAPQSTPPADPKVTGPAPEPTPVDNVAKPDYSGGQKVVTPTVKYNDATNATAPETPAKPETPTKPEQPSQDAQQTQNNQQAQDTQPTQNTQQAQPRQSLWNKIKSGAKDFGQGVMAGQRAGTPIKTRTGANPQDKTNLKLAADILPMWRKFSQQYLAGYGNTPENLKSAAKAFAEKNYFQAGKNQLQTGLETVVDSKSADLYIARMANLAVTNLQANINPDTDVNVTAPPTQTTSQSTILGADGKPIIVGADGKPIASAKTSAASPDAHDATDAKHDVVPGAEIVQQDPIIMKYKNKEYGLNDKGQWVQFGSTKVPHESFQAFLDKHAGFGQ